MPIASPEKNLVTQSNSHQEISRLVVECAALLLKYGAETALVETLSTRLGLSLGVSSVECSITSMAIVLTTVHKNRYMTITRKNIDAGIDMYIVAQVQKIVINTELGNFSTIEEVKDAFDSIEVKRYPSYLVVIMVGIACAAFCRLAGGSLHASLITFLSSTLGMGIRLKISKLHINPIINFYLTAFVTTSICGFLFKLIPNESPQVAMGACVLLLVPGFPLVNSISDMFKGYVNMGISRWITVFWYVLATCLGITTALQLFQLQGWS